MTDYKKAWKVRKIQIIVVNLIFGVISIYGIISGSNVVETLTFWFVGAWLVETMLAAFSKSGDRVSSLALNIGASLFSGVFAATSGGSVFWVFYFTISIVKAIFGLIVISAILAFEFVAFPFTTLNYYLKSKR